MSFSFGSNANQSAFGTPNKPTGFGAPLSFGTPAASSAAAPTPGFSFGGSTFGTPAANQTQTQPSLFGAAASTPAPAFGSSPGLFGQPAATKPSLFGTSTTPSTSGLFSSTATPLFGASTTTPAATQPSLFGAGATTTTTPSLFGGGGSLFGNTNTFSGNTSSLFGATNPNQFKPVQPGQPQQQPEATNAQQTLASFYAINLYNDERDDILKKWNMLQACWGTGKGYYSQSQPPVDYNTCNPFYRFKAISYVIIPGADNADGLVKLVFNKKEADVIAQKSVIINGLNGILGNKPNLTLTVQHIKSISDNETEMMITVAEKGVTGTSRKIHATDLSQYLNQPAQKQQLTGAGVTVIGPYVMPSKAQLEEYLKEPPPGIDEQMWKAAQVDNPNPKKYLPNPITGFSNLKKRMLSEEHETGLHRAFLQKADREINELRKRHAASMAQIAEQKQKFLQLQHRVLRILVKQESTRKAGLALLPQEEMLRARLENMQAHLNMPTQFRGKINELLSSCRVMNTMESAKNESYKIDPKVQEDVKQFLTMEQNGISHLIRIINKDLRDLKVMSDGMNQMMVGTK